jgi:hypothetical protein
MDDALHAISTVERLWIGTACLPNNKSATMRP